MKVRLELNLLCYTPPCYSYVNDVVPMLISWNLHEKSSEVSIRIHNKVYYSLPFIHRPGN